MELPVFIPTPNFQEIKEIVILTKTVLSYLQGQDAKANMNNCIYRNNRQWHFKNTKKYLINTGQT